MSAERIILIVVLLVVGAHLMLFGWLRRRIAEAKREQAKREQDEGRSD
jgi:UDP-N-acetylmuramyl pentapeptide synthase